jgi:hypothetical protein
MTLYHIHYFNLDTYKKGYKPILAKTSNKARKQVQKPTIMLTNVIPIYILKGKEQHYVT